ncbi:uncharacterized protein LOC144297841 isoform X3 [Canis aureus]
MDDPQERWRHLKKLAPGTAPRSQDLFAFEWTDPEKGINGQLTWTRPPQGFRNSPTIFMRPYTKTWVHGVRADLQDQPLPNADATWYMEGSSFVREGVRSAGAAATSETETVWAEPLAAERRLNGQNPHWPRR